MMTLGDASVSGAVGWSRWDHGRRGLRRGSVLVVLWGVLAGSSPGLVTAEGSFADQLRTGIPFELEISDSESSSAAGEPLSYTVRGTRWEPHVESDRPVVVYNHGLQSHQGWFYGTGEELSRDGFPVLAFDRIGSGRSDTGAEGARGHVRSWRLFVETLDQMVREANRRWPGRPVIVWGNSYGAKVVTAYLFDRRSTLSDRGVVGAVYTVPGLFRNEDTMPLTFSRFRLLFSGSLHRFPVPMAEVDGDNGAAWFITPGPWFDRIREDELSLREGTRRFWLQTARLDRFVRRRPAGERLPVPALFLMVEGDRLMDNEKMLDFIERRAAAESRHRFFEGGPESSHFLLFTEDREPALDTIEEFAEGRTE